MAIVVNHNIPALQSYNAVTATSSALQKSIGRLSTGLRVNSAADDAAGLAISEKMRAQIRGLDQGVRNAQDGVSMIQTAEGALSETHSILQRMRELAVQSANDALTQQDRGYIQLEIDQLKEEIDRIANTTQFNKKKLLNGNTDALWSTNLLGTRVVISDTIRTTDQFGQPVSFEGNYTITADVEQKGQNQVLKSNILNRLLPSGEVVTANVDAKLSTLTAFTDANGVNLLSQPQTLTISFENGGSASITLYAQDTVGDLAAKFSQAIGNASGISGIDNVGVQYVVGTDSLPDEKNEILMGMASGWLESSMKRIEEEYGITIAPGKLTIEIVDTLGSFAGGQAEVKGSEGVIRVSMEKWLEAIQGSSVGDEIFGEQVTAHELVHIVTFMDPNLYAAQMDYDGRWLQEGIADYISGGANVTVYRDTNGGDDLSTVNAEIQQLIDVINYSQKIDFDTTPEYSAAYLAVRYFDANNGSDKRGR
jgi:flagellin-like hook-associated protein FlgL